MSITPAKKILGQHWLTDQQILQDIVQAASIKSDDTVLEIGPGTGTLTNYLQTAQARVIALEYDQSLLPALQDKFKNTNINIEAGDIRRYNLALLPAGYKIVANIPYYLSNYLLRLLADTANKPALAVLLVQQEVAQRVTARPGQMSSISVFVQRQYEVSQGIIVPPNAFEPPPQVTSQVLILKRRKEPLFRQVDGQQFSQLVKAGFSSRRKTLLNALSGGLHLSKDSAKGLLALSGISPQKRAQNLSLDDWHLLYQKWHKHLTC